MVQEYLLKKFDNILVYQKIPQRADKNLELHTQPNKKEFWDATLVEMFLLAKCDFLYCNTGSWFSRYARAFVPPVKVENLYYGEK